MTSETNEVTSETKNRMTDSNVRRPPLNDKIKSEAVYQSPSKILKTKYFNFGTTPNKIKNFFMEQGQTPFKSGNISLLAQFIFYRCVCVF